MKNVCGSVRPPARPDWSNMGRTELSHGSSQPIFGDVGSWKADRGFHFHSLSACSPPRFSWGAVRFLPDDESSWRCHTRAAPRTFATIRDAHSRHTHPRCPLCALEHHGVRIQGRHAGSRCSRNVPEDRSGCGVGRSGEIQFNRAVPFPIDPRVSPSL